LEETVKNISLHSDHCEIFGLARAFDCCKPIKEIKRVVLKQSVFHLIILMYTQGYDISILFKNDYHISTSDRLAKLFIETPNRAWTVELAAKMMFTSASTLRRNLSKENSSFSKVLIDVRIGIAMKYLTFTNLSILKISSLSGFNSSTHFCTVLKKTPYYASGI
jgi:AraC-like DNA-binding protein